MTTSHGVELKDLLVRLTMDEQGRIVMDGQRTVIIPAAVFGAIEPSGSGSWAGVIGALRRQDVTLEETSCRSRGAPVCEFAVRALGA